MIITMEVEIRPNDYLKDETKLAEHGQAIAKTIKEEYPASVKDVRVLRVD